MIENKYSDLSETKLRKLRVNSKDPMTKVTADLLTPDEITAMMKACTRPVERALIMTLYEGGFRIGEIGTMTWGILMFDKYGIIANVNFKTNMPRYRPTQRLPGPWSPHCHFRHLPSLIR